MRLIPHSGRRIMGLAMTLATLSIATIMQAAPPAPVITTPAAAPNNVYRDLAAAEGTASGTGLSAVQVLLRRKTAAGGYEFWNNTAWHPAPVTGPDLLPATPTGAGNSFSSWTFSFAGVDDLRDGRYEIAAGATDSSGRTFSAYKPFILDTTAPQVRVISPRLPSYSVLNKALFAATDNVSGVKQVFGVLRRIVRISVAPGYRYEYWTGGDTWTTDATTPAVLRPTTETGPGTNVYELDLPTLPVANYFIGAYAFDFADDPATEKQENQGKTQVPIPNTNPQRFDFWTKFRISGLNIRGRITNAGVGVAGVDVYAAPTESALLAAIQGVADIPQAQTIDSAVAAEEGTFLIRGLVTGSYFVAPVQPGTFFNNAANLPVTPVQVGNSTVHNVNFTVGGTDSTDPTVDITSHTFFGAYSTSVSGTANDTGGAKLLGVALAIARREGFAATGFYNFSTNQFDPITDPALLGPSHIKLANPILPATPFNWTISGLPTLPAGDYALVAGAADSAGNLSQEIVPVTAE